jgi:hypothetical protein
MRNEKITIDESLYIDKYAKYENMSKEKFSKESEIQEEEEKKDEMKIKYKINLLMGQLKEKDLKAYMKYEKIISGIK